MKLLISCREFLLLVIWNSSYRNHSFQPLHPLKNLSKTKSTLCVPNKLICVYRSLWSVVIIKEILDSYAMCPRWPCLAGRLDLMNSRGPFQPQQVCVILWLFLLFNFHLFLFKCNKHLPEQQIRKMIYNYKKYN